MNEHYTILGVSRTASTSEIKSAYKKLAIKYHPDKNPNSEDQFKLVNEAYSILSDDAKRATYDNKMSFSNDFKRWGNAFGKANTASGFHKSTHRGVSAKGQDLRVNFTITFKESISGIEKTVDVNRRSRCSMCDGTGASTQKQCNVCNGKGTVRKVHRASFMDDENSINLVPCDACNGGGLVIDTICPLCKGDTTLPETKRVKIKIPPGINDGDVVKVIGFGSAGRSGGINGDILAYIMVLSDPDFYRKGNDVYTSIEVSPSDLVLGKEIKIELVNKTVKAEIPRGTKSTAKIKLNKEGIKDGALFIAFTVVVPTDASDEEIILYEKLRELEWNCGN